MPTRDYDLINCLLGLEPTHPLLAVRALRERVSLHTQGSHDALLHDDDPHLHVTERQLCAWYAAQASGSPLLAEHYCHQLTISAEGRQLWQAYQHGGITSRIHALLDHVRLLIHTPAQARQQDVQALLNIDVAPASIVLLAQLSGFVAYQARVLAHLLAQGGALQDQVPRSPVQGRGDPRTFGFTPLVWGPWIDPVALHTASPEQLAVLDASHAHARQSPYYLTLIHQPGILQERSGAYNAILYGPRGLPRAERELVSTQVSRINGCAYCSAVHAQRYQQLTRGNDAILSVYRDPNGPFQDARQAALLAYTGMLTEAPSQVAAHHIDALRDAGLSELEILDLGHVTAVFAWANRLMLSLGHPLPGSGS